MPRSLGVLLALAVMSGCALPIEVPVRSADPVSSTPYPAVERWINLQTEVQQMTAQEIAARLVEIDKPESVGQWYYYGLLNQELGDYGAWILARDAFAGIADNTLLGPTQRQIAQIMRRYNQVRINAYIKQENLNTQTVSLQQQLAIAEEEKLLLQQKIQALTDLEAVISTRKEE